MCLIGVVNIHTYIYLNNGIDFDFNLEGKHLFKKCERSELVL